jgi:shikimate dehydrogenase
MTGKPALDLDLAHMPKSAIVNDIVYAPLQTELLRAAAARGNHTVTGIGMLLHQARAGFHAWFGVNPDVTNDLEVEVLQP